MMLVADSLFRSEYAYPSISTIHNHMDDIRAPCVSADHLAPSQGAPRSLILLMSVSTSC